MVRLARAQFANLLPFGAMCQIVTGRLLRHVDVLVQIDTIRQFVVLKCIQFSNLLAKYLKIFNKFVNIKTDFL